MPFIGLRRERAGAHLNKWLTRRMNKSSSVFNKRENHFNSEENEHKPEEQYREVITNDP